MAYSQKYVTYPNVRDMDSVHKHIQDVHSLFMDAGFIQSSDINQYDITNKSDYDYSLFLDSTSYNTFYDMGRLVFDFPDYYDEDGCALKLKIGIIFSVVKVTPFSTPTLSNCPIVFYHRFFISPVTDGESNVLAPFSTYNQGLYIYHSSNTNTGLGYTNSANNSIVSYDKISKTFYLNICPYYRYGHSQYNGYSSLSMIFGTMATDKYGKFYDGNECTFNFFMPYYSYSTGVNNGTFESCAYELDLTGTSKVSILNTPMTVTANALPNGCAYYQNMFCQTKQSSYVSPSKNILIVHNNFSHAHNTITDLKYDDEHVGRFISVNIFTYARAYLNSDTSGYYNILVRIPDNE